MKLSEFLQILSLVILPSVAIFGPLVTDWIRRRRAAPQLKISIEAVEPYFIKAEYGSQDPAVPHEPVYYFRFPIRNDGKSVAKLCEATLEELWIHDAAGNPRKKTEFTPIYLNIEGATPVRPGGHPFVDINPERSLLCVLGHISSPSYQEREERKQFIPAPNSDNKELRFMLDIVGGAPYHQPNCFSKGKYTIKVSIYSENAGHHIVYLQLDWTGKWQNESRDMLRELVITMVPRPTP